MHTAAWPLCRSRRTWVRTVQKEQEGLVGLAARRDRVQAHARADVQLLVAPACVLWWQLHLGGRRGRAPGEHLGRVGRAREQNARKRIVGTTTARLFAPGVMGGTTLRRLAD